MPSYILFIKRVLLFFVTGIFFYSSAKAQPCTISISNNSFEIKPATCAGTVAMLVGSSPVGGNGTYSYQWEKSIGNCNSNNFQPIAGAVAKDYPVSSTTDPNDCFRRVVVSGSCASNSNTSKVALQDRTIPSSPSTLIVQPICSTGTGSITITSPIGTDISYSIDGSNYTNTSGIFMALAAGTYSVTAKMPAGCISPSNTVILNSLPAITGTISPAAATFCAGGSQVLTVNGGTSYQWYKNGVLISGATSNTYTATTAGTYTATIFLGFCSGSSSNSAVVTVTPLPTGSISPTSGTICPPGGSLTLTVNGGTSYQWFKNGVAQPGATSATYTATSSGTYTANITASGCTSLAGNSAIISQGILPSGFITPATGALCPGGIVPLTVTTASGVNTYQWFRNGAFITGATGAVFNATQTGTYSVLIFNGSCSGSASNTVSVSDAASIGFSTASTNPSCASPTGSIAVSGVTGGGSSIYIYSKDNGNSYQTAATFTNLVAGTYQVVVKDTAGCISSPKAVVIQSFASTLSATANTTNTRCGLPNGSVITNASGGTQPYTYKIDNGNYQTSNSFSNLVVGNHIVTVKDAPGCTYNISFPISVGSVNPNLVITPPAICPGFTANLESLAITKGSDTLLAYTYWTDSTASTPLINPAAVIAGTYYIKATNLNGCFTIQPVTVTVKQDCLSDGKVFVPAAFTPNKNGTNDVLRPIFYNVTDLHYFKVYNRWGQQVFETSTVGKGWDGTLKGSPQPAETYSWILEYVGKNGDLIKEGGRSLLIR